MQYTDLMSREEKMALADHLAFVDELDMDTLVFVAENTDTQAEFDEQVALLIEADVMSDVTVRKAQPKAAKQHGRLYQRLKARNAKSLNA